MIVSADRRSAAVPPVQNMTPTSDPQKEMRQGGSTFCPLWRVLVRVIFSATEYVMGS